MPILAPTIRRATAVNPLTGIRKAVTVGDPKALTGGFQLETGALHRALQDATKGDQNKLNDPAYVRGVFGKVAMNAKAYPDVSSGLVPLGSTPMHQEIQGTVDAMRQAQANLAAMEAENSATLRAATAAGVPRGMPVRPTPLVGATAPTRVPGPSLTPEQQARQIQMAEAARRDFMANQILRARASLTSPAQRAVVPTMPTMHMTSALRTNPTDILAQLKKLQSLLGTPTHG